MFARTWNLPCDAPPALDRRVDVHHPMPFFVSTCALGCYIKIIQYMWFLGGTSSRVPRGYDEFVSEVGGDEAWDFAVDQEVQMTIGTDLAGALRTR